MWWRLQEEHRGPCSVCPHDLHVQAWPTIGIAEQRTHLCGKLSVGGGLGFSYLKEIQTLAGFVPEAVVDGGYRVQHVRHTWAAKAECLCHEFFFRLQCLLHAGPNSYRGRVRVVREVLVG